MTQKKYLVGQCRLEGILRGLKLDKEGSHIRRVRRKHSMQPIVQRLEHVLQLCYHGVKSAKFVAFETYVGQCSHDPLEVYKKCLCSPEHRSRMHAELYALQGGPGSHNRRVRQTEDSMKVVIELSQSF